MAPVSVPRVNSGTGAAVPALVCPFPAQPLPSCARWDVCPRDDMGSLAASPGPLRFWRSKGWPSSHLSCGEAWPDVVLVECKAKNCSNEWTSTLLVSLGWKYIASSFTEHYHVLNLYRKMQFCKLYNCCAMAFSSFPLSHKPVFVSSPPSHQCY